MAGSQAGGWRGYRIREHGILPVGTMGDDAKPGRSGHASDGGRARQGHRRRMFLQAQVLSAAVDADPAGGDSGVQPNHGAPIHLGVENAILQGRSAAQRGSGRSISARDTAALRHVERRHGARCAGHLHAARLGQTGGVRDDARSMHRPSGRGGGSRQPGVQRSHGAPAARPRRVRVLRELAV